MSFLGLFRVETFEVKPVFPCIDVPNLPISEVMRSAGSIRMIMAGMEVTGYGTRKTVRYMIESTSEFLEVLHTVDQILGRVTDRCTLESLQREAIFDIIPLPHSQDKFIAVFAVPSELLGQTSGKRPQHLEYANYPEHPPHPRVVQKPQQILCSFDVNTLFDINLSLSRFKDIVAPSVNAAQWLSMRRALSIIISPRPQPDRPLTMVVIADLNSGGRPAPR